MAAARYSIDTSALIDGWTGYYPPDVFPGMWEKLEELADQGILIASEEVLHELERKEDELHKWAKQRPHMFVPFDEPVQKAVREILCTHRNLLKQGKTRSGADPFVIAVARTRQCTVVTGERPSGNPQNKPHIPDVCRAYSIRYLSLLDLLREQGWVFRRS